MTTIEQNKNTSTQIGYTRNAFSTFNTSALSTYLLRRTEGRSQRCTAHLIHGDDVRPGEGLSLLVFYLKQRGVTRRLQPQPTEEESHHPICRNSINIEERSVCFSAKVTHIATTLFVFFLEKNSAIGRSRYR